MLCFVFIVFGILTLENLAENYASKRFLKFNLDYRIEDYIKHEKKLIDNYMITRGSFWIKMIYQEVWKDTIYKILDKRSKSFKKLESKLQRMQNLEHYFKVVEEEKRRFERKRRKALIIFLATYLVIAFGLTLGLLSTVNIVIAFCIIALIFYIYSCVAFWFGYELDSTGIKILAYSSFVLGIIYSIIAITIFILELFGMFIPNIQTINNNFFFFVSRELKM